MARRFRWVSVLFTLTLVISLLLGRVAKVNAQANQGDLWLQQGVTEYQQREYQAAITLWQKALASYQARSDNPNQVIALENLARVYQQIGQPERAIAFWSQVKEHYQQQGNQQQLGRSLTELAQAYSSIGQHRQAINLLCAELSNDSTECSPFSAIALANNNDDALGIAAAKGSLGEAYRLRGNYIEALDSLEGSLEVAKTLENSQLEISALNSFGNTHSSLAQISYRQAESAERRGEIFGKTGEEYAPDSPVMRLREDGNQQDRIALDYFQDSLAIANQQEDVLAQVRSLISSLEIYYRLSDSIAAAQSRQQALDLVSTLNAESTTVYATIDLAKLLQPNKVSFSSCYSQETLTDAQNLLQRGVDLAQQLGDSRAASFALGELGHTYECAQDYPQALALTKQARFAAEQHKDSLYLWEWQTGRILQAQSKSQEAIQRDLARQSVARVPRVEGTVEGGGLPHERYAERYPLGLNQEAIAAYETAITTLDSIRDDLLTANRDVQFDFRDTVEPIYRGLITRRLSDVEQVSVIQPTETQQVNNVNSILTTVDSLRLAELQNYFGDDCAISDLVATEKVDLLAPAANTAYFSTIILEDRTAVIANFPGRKSKIVWHDNKGEGAIAEEINQFRRGLERIYGEFDVTPGQNIYSWLVEPFAPDLEREQITTLVFIQDGLLRSIPMAALHDGKQFLIQKYAIATTPSLNLTRFAAPQSQDLKALALGLSQASQVNNQPFPALTNVEQEIQQVQNIFAESTGIMNDSFTRDRLEEELTKTSYPIVHIATHGQFSSEPEDTFLVMGNNEKLTLTELDRMIRSTATANEPVDLIALTACQTAVGDERAALGLAGIAIQAGVNSALASLWSINDEVTPTVVENFYLGLRDRNLSKAAALREAQTALIDQDFPPALWSPFIIIGNWQ